MGGILKTKGGAPLAQQQTILHAIPITTSSYGQTITLLYGKNRLPGKLLDYTDFTPVAHTSSQKVGGKGGIASGGNQNITQTTYTYTALVMIALCEGPITGLRNVYDTKGKLVLQSTTVPFTVPGGGGTFTPPPPKQGKYYDDGGAGVDTGYSQPVNDFGSDGSHTLSGTYRVPFRRVTGAPGAGQYSVDPSTGQYTFHAADAGKVVQISYVYSVPDTTGTVGAPPTQLSFTVLLGQVPQAPWGVMVTKHPERALSYAGLAYIADPSMDLGTGGTLPNFTYEIVGLFPFGAGIDDANPADIVTDFLTNQRHGSGLSSSFIGPLTQFSNYCVANGIFLSPIYDTQTTGADMLTQILTLTNTAQVFSEGLLKFIPYGDTSVAGNGAIFIPNTTPVYDLDTTDFIDKQGSDPVTFSIAGVSSNTLPLTNVTILEILDRTNDYNPVPIEDKDEASIQLYGPRPQTSFTAHEICSPAIAATVAMAMNRRAVNIRTTYSFELPIKYILLEPMDLVTITDPVIGNKVPVRLTQIEEDASGNLLCEAEEFPWGTATPTLYPKQSASGYGPQSLADPGLVNTPVMFECPPDMSRSGQHELWIAISGGMIGNYLLYSEDFTAALGYWVGAFGGSSSAPTITANTTANPVDGLVTADTINFPTVAAGANESYIASTFRSLPNSAVKTLPLTYSIWLKVASGTAQVVLNMESSPSFVFNPSQLVTVTTAWQRFSLTANMAPTTDTVGCFLIVNFAQAAVGLITFGAQLEISPTMGTYIQTIGQQGLAYNPDWGGCSILASLDNTTYTKIGAVHGAARTGLLAGTPAFPTQVWGVTSDPYTGVIQNLWDMRQSNGVLVPGSQADADAYRTLTYLGGEFISYAAIAPVTANQYNPAGYIRRGLFGSTIASHNIGTQIARLDDAIFTYAYDASFIGQTVFLKFTSFNTLGSNEQLQSEVNNYTFVVTGRFNQMETIGKNLCSNPGFEYNLSNVALGAFLNTPNARIVDGWRVSSVFTNPALIATIQTFAPHTGTYALTISIQPRSLSVGDNILAVETDRVPISPGESYAFGGWIRLDAGVVVPTSCSVFVGMGLALYTADGTFVQHLSPLTGIGSFRGALNFTAGQNTATGYQPFDGYVTIAPSYSGLVPAYASLFFYNLIHNGQASAFTAPTGICDARVDDAYWVPQALMTGNEVGNQGSKSVTYTGYVGSFHYANDASSITWITAGLGLNRTDLSQTIDIIPNISQQISGLTINTHYNFYLFIDEVNKVFGGVATGGIGTPFSWAHTGTSINWTQELMRADHFPLSTGAIDAATSTGGTGSGGIPPPSDGGCLRSDVLVEEKSRGIIALKDLKGCTGLFFKCPVNEDTPDGWAEVARLRFKENSVWIHSHFSNGDWLATTFNHPFTLDDGTTKSACQLTFTDGFPCTTGIAGLTSHARHAYIEEKVSVQLNTKLHLFYSGIEKASIQNHNVNKIPVS
jgi:hypothetical protein